jgi:uncharacterized membrane protein YkvA (DUF1232 family)
MDTRDGDIIPPEQAARDRRAVESGFWPKVKRTLGRIPFSEDAVAGFYCATDPKTPTGVKAILFGALAYFILPTDVIPDIIVAFGYADDAAVLTAALAAVRGALGEGHRKAARRWLETETVTDSGRADDDAQPVN